MNVWHAEDSSRPPTCLTRIDNQIKDRNESRMSVRLNLLEPFFNRIAKTFCASCLFANGGIGHPDTKEAHFIFLLKFVFFQHTLSRHFSTGTINKMQGQAVPVWFWMNWEATRRVRDPHTSEPRVVLRVISPPNSARL